MDPRSVVIVTHKLYHGVPDDLKKFFIQQQCERVYFIAHEFTAIKTRRSYIEEYENGQHVSTTYSPDFIWMSDALMPIKDFVYTIWWLLVRVKKPEIYVGCAAFNCLAGILLRPLKRIKKIIFYTIDYVPERFKSRAANEFYHRVDTFALSHADETWNLSARMAEGREKLRGYKASDYPQRVVPVGIWFHEITRVPFAESHPHEVVFVGILLEKQGVQTVLRAIPTIVQSIPDFRFVVIGGGPYEQALKSLTSELGIEPHVEFTGTIFDQTVVNEKLSHGALAVALYDRVTDNFTYYADPTKIKTYLGIGVPVMLTDVPHNAHELAQAECAVIVEYNPESVATEIIKLLGDHARLQHYRERAVAYAATLDWNLIFSHALHG